MLTISDAIDAIQNKLPATSFQRFKTFLDKTGFRKHDKCIVSFFLLPINDRARFLDFSNTNWSSDSTKKNAISAVSSALDTDIIKKQYTKEQYDDIKKALAECMASVGKKNTTQHEEHADDVNIDDVNIDDDVTSDDIDSIHSSGNNDDLISSIELIHQELTHFRSNISSISSFAKSVHDRFNDSFTQIELERNQLKEENKALAKQLALASKANNASAIITSLLYSIDILLALYKDSCQSLKTYEAFEAIIRKQIDQHVQLLQPTK